MELAEFQRFLQFLTDRQPDEKPMPEEQVQLICAQFPHRKMPALVLAYLRTCGAWIAAGCSEAWCGVIEDGKFQDYGEFIREIDYADKDFRKYGFAYEDCFFFLDCQELMYVFVYLDGERDDPLVYSFFTDGGKPQLESRLFSQWFIDDYNRWAPEDEKWHG